MEASACLHSINLAISNRNRWVNGMLCDACTAKHTKQVSKQRDVSDELYHPIPYNPSEPQTKAAGHANGGQQQNTTISGIYLTG